MLILYLALVIIFTHLAGREKPGRADRSFGRIARRQPVLVSRQRRCTGDALPAAGDRDDVSANPRDPQAAVARTPAPRDPAVALSFSVTHTSDAACDHDSGNTLWRTLRPMSFQLTYDAIAKRIDHSLLAPTLSHAGARGRLPAGGAVRRGQRLHQALRRGAGRADSQGFGRGGRARPSGSRTAVMRRR